MQKYIKLPLSKYNNFYCKGGTVMKDLFWILYLLHEEKKEEEEERDISESDSDDNPMWLFVIVLILFAIFYKLLN